MLFLFMAKKYSTVWIYPNLPVYLLKDICFFYILTIMNNSAISIHVEKKNCIHRQEKISTYNFQEYFVILNWFYKFSRYE